MRYRKLDASGDMTFGRSLRDLWIDVPDAVQQAVKTRLMLYEGEWYLAPDDGTPWKTRVLGHRTEGYRDAVLRTRILGTEGVQQITEYSSHVDRDTRTFSVDAKLDTVYGEVVLKGPL